MKNKDLRNKVILSNIIIAILIVVTTIILIQDNFSKTIGGYNTYHIIYLFPLMALLLSLILLLVSRFIEKDNIQRNIKTYLYLNMNCTLFLAIGQIILLMDLTISNINIPFQSIFLGLIGIIIASFGNNLPRIKHGSWMEKICIVFHNNENLWRKYSRFAGYIWLMTGLVIMTFSILANFNYHLAVILTILTIILVGIGLIIYALLINREE